MLSDYFRLKILKSAGAVWSYLSYLMISSTLVNRSECSIN